MVKSLGAKVGVDLDNLLPGRPEANNGATVPVKPKTSKKGGAN
jgi:hypothetical protein